MESLAEVPTNPPVKRVAAGIIAVVLLTMGLLVWFGTDMSSSGPDPVVTQQPGGAPPLLNFPFLDKADYEEKDDGIRVKYPAEMASLDGKKVAIAGFMTPYESLDDMHQFLLMPSSGGCFFCQAPSLSQVIMVHQAVPAGATAKLPFIQEPIMVTATLHLYAKGSENPGHKAGFIFDLDDAQISKISDSAAEAAGLVGAPPPVRK
jgi:hypothetical protein